MGDRNGWRQNGIIRGAEEVEDGFGKRWSKGGGTNVLSETRDPERESVYRAFREHERHQGEGTEEGDGLSLIVPTVAHEPLKVPYKYGPVSMRLSLCITLRVGVRIRDDRRTCTHAFHRRRRAVEKARSVARRKNETRPAVAAAVLHPRVHRSDRFFPGNLVKSLGGKGGGTAVIAKGIRRCGFSTTFSFFPSVSLRMLQAPKGLDGNRTELTTRASRFDFSKSSVRFEASSLRIVGFIYLISW